MTAEEGRRTYRLPPCPAYDVAGMEGWLEELAQKGWFLARDGFFAGVGTFERGDPKPVRYRLSGSMKSTSMWADNGGAPDPEEVALCESYAWEYVGTRGGFTIYRTLDPNARELNTDPEVQAVAVKAVRGRRCSALAYVLFWLILYPILYFHGGFLLTAIQLHSWYFCLTVFLVLLLFSGSLWEVIRLGKLQRRLQNDETIPPAAPTNRQAGGYWGRRAALAALAVLWVCITLNRWSASVLDEDKTPRSQAAPPPFATLADFAGEGASGYRETWNSLSFNYVQTWKDWLAPRNIKWVEHARITRADGTVLDGGLYVDYHEAASSLVAAGLVRDYVRHDRRQKGFTALETPSFDAEYIQAYTTVFPTVVFQRGNIVIHASFYQTGDGPQLPLEEWAGRLAESVLPSQAPR